ncbi:MAG: UDP-N-acetylmuramoyl-tripeptide--D-alanyl-D-alanine ligase [Betaproteobacteria bacterium]|nr:UDP-N-acetylmuramoyl-tripeptide--D-alanyl-D-alanine ligase [Betaproteobacteria bacterium]
MMQLSDAARMIGARTSGDATLTGVSTDSRSIARGEMFVALRGERFDGHAFLADVVARGAAAALVDSAFAASGAALPLPVLIADDTRRALGQLARAWRKRFSPAMIAIAGSNGKTTTKEMLAAILRAASGEAQVLATAGNLNNDIGLPLTLLRLREAHAMCAIELGMNHKGETAYLAQIACPGIALVTNAQREHLEFMNSVEEVAAENASVYAALPEDGIAVVNADDPHAQLFCAVAGSRRVIEFALDRHALVSGRCRLKPLSSEIRVATPAGAAEATLVIPGVHNVRNAIGAAACAHAAGVGPAAIAAGLNAFRPYSGRLQVKHAARGATLIDDSYNANPDSVRAAIDVLALAAGRTVLVLGDMGEVGDQGVDFHAEIGRYAKERGVEALYAVGELTAHSVAGFGQGARHFATAETLHAALEDWSGPGHTLLVKGSRFMRMERVVAALAGCGKLAEAHP